MHLMIEGTYLTQAAWSIDAEKNLPKANDFWWTFTVLKLEHAAMLSMGAAVATTASALFL